MRLGLFGGTFDPPHTGHLIAAQDAAFELRLDRVLFVPAAIPPHKQQRQISAPDLRLRMLELAVADNPTFAIEPLELQRSGPSYTVDTLRELSQRGTARYTLLLGADQYVEFDTWREPDTIRQLADIAVLEREGVTMADTARAKPAPAVAAAGATHVRVTRIDISSTDIRARVARGQPIRYLVPAAVEKFIYDHNLYVRNGTPRAG